MAFMGIFMMGLVTFLIIAAVLVISAISFLVISLVMKQNYKKKLSEAQDGDKKPRKWYIVPRVFCILNVAPLVFMAVMFVVSHIHTQLEHRNSLAYNVMDGNYERVEALLKKGVDPDCTLRGNEPATDGLQTLLSELCENHGFTDNYDDPVDYEVTAEELEMMELLIEYGADVNSVSYKHDKNNSRHFTEDEYSFYNTDDICGYTPLLYAIRYTDADIVRLLIENGADVNVRDYCGYSAVATIADNLDDEEGLEILELLVENGADINATTNYGQSPQWLAFRQTTGQTPLDNEEIRKILGNVN